VFPVCDALSLSRGGKPLNQRHGVVSQKTWNLHLNMFCFE